MNQTALHWLGRSFVVAAVALLAACAGDAPVGLNRAFEIAPVAEIDRDPDLGVCQDLYPEEGSKLAFHVYAKGVQIYRWTGTTWAFQGPEAELFADAAWKSIVGIHYGGPTWESVSGSKVVGTILKRCTPDPDAVQWLLLGVVSNVGPGIFDGVAFIQRVNTVGGIAPSSGGSTIGEEARVPYTTEYFFYRAP